MKAVTERVRLEGHVALITGAGGHVGRAVARAMAELGAHLALLDLPAALKALDVPALEACSGGRVEMVPVDLEHPEEIREAVGRVVGSFSRVDILVNNAAFVGTSDLAGWAVPLEQQSLETWQRALAVNLTAPFLLTQLLAGPLRRARGTVINVSSIYGLVGPDGRLYQGTPLGNPAAYAASKGGLIQLTRWFATVLAPQVRVNCVAPGGIERAQPDVFLRRYRARTPLRRMGREEDVVGAVVYLATDLSSYVTGQVVVVDGGYAAW